MIYLLAAHAGLTVNAQSAGILTVLVFGAGTDYALLLVARYREELRRHEDRHEAMAVALRRAGPAIIASAGTVILGMLCLLARRAELDQGPGPGRGDRHRGRPARDDHPAAGAAGDLRPLGLLAGQAAATARPSRPTRGFWARIGRRIAAGRAWSGSPPPLVLGVLALGLTGLNANGLTNAESFRGHPDSVVGRGGARPALPGRRRAAGRGHRQRRRGARSSAAALRAVPGITGVTPPVVRAGHAYLEGTLTVAPDSQAAYDTIDRVRAAVHAVPGADAMVGGNTAINLDVQRAAAHDRNLIIPIVLVVVFLVLALLLRALVAPLHADRDRGAVVRARRSGVSALVFDHVFGFGGADTSFPLFVFVFLVALGIDYNIFLMTRVREEAKRHGTRRGRADRAGRHRRRDHLGRRSCWPARSPCSARCRWSFLPRSASRSRSACCSTPSWSGRCWSPR